MLGNEREQLACKYIRLGPLVLHVAGKEHTSLLMSVLNPLVVVDSHLKWADFVNNGIEYALTS